MVKKILGISMVSAMLLLSGCGESTGEDRLAAEQELDKGGSTATIALLESKSTLTDSEIMQLASAYMAAAGLSYSEMLKIITASTETAAPAPAKMAPSSSSNSFANFLTELEKKLSPKSLEYLSKAIEKYNSMSAQNDDAKLFSGMAYTAKAATAISYMGDMQALIDANIAGEVSDELVAYGCAISYVYANTYESKCSSVSYGDRVNVKSYPFVEINAVVNGVTYRKLANTDLNETILTDGYCLAEGTSAALGDTGAYACPVDNGQYYISDVLIDTLNEGFTQILAAAPDDVKGDIQQFRDEIDADKSGLVTPAEIATYIANNVQ